MLTKKQVVSMYKDMIHSMKYQDDTAIRCGFNDFTDMLCKDGEITLKQYETWINPFDKTRRK